MLEAGIKMVGTSSFTADRSECNATSASSHNEELHQKIIFITFPAAEYIII